jgi:hypothetical protein
MSTQEYTLIAALIAAIVSIISLFVHLIAQHSAELRKAHRETLESFMHDLGESLYSTIATSDILLKAQSPPSIINWRKRADDAKTRLKELRAKLRYPLWGLDKALKTISRLPDWIEHARQSPNHARNILRAGVSLGRSLDSTIRKCYMYGRPPRLHERLIVKYKRWRLEKEYLKFQTRERK